MTSRDRPLVYALLSGAAACLLVFVSVVLGDPGTLANAATVLGLAASLLMGCSLLVMRARAQSLRGKVFALTNHRILVFETGPPTRVISCPLVADFPFALRPAHKYPTVRVGHVVGAFLTKDDKADRTDAGKVHPMSRFQTQVTRWVDLEQVSDAEDLLCRIEKLLDPREGT